MFGGNNVSGREINSAQISAGIHIPNSLNIVGMSSDGSSKTRRMDIWAEDGLRLYGHQFINATANCDNDGSRLKNLPNNTVTTAVSDSALYLLYKDSNGEIRGIRMQGNPIGGSCSGIKQI
jgi:hypothetical protein